MLQIKDISKEYRTGNLVQKALDHVSLNLRDNEFVAILGPSGSGKTTLLNVIGGLDRYDSGDLIINGVSTRKYKDRDWDSYRNHTIGFVFQSYNLIPHQTVLANVELALTISGISGKERRERALEALNKVGLGEQAHKKPSQMSGGQMQRVAIARALVNDPDILLADEPTGALDSETSVQVMNLLKEVASDRLVVMVTHNPELAEEYATRIVNLKDGVIRSDTDPYVVDQEEEAVHRNLGRSSMSFFTALSLSFNNLRTKLARTILVAFAGSIGIIGIAMILSLSNGVNQYIKDTEEETLLGYPVTIQSTSFDITSMMAQAADNQKSDEEQTDDVKERAFLNNMLSRTKSNDLEALRNYLEDESNIYDYASAIEYSFSLTPHIYRIEGDSYRQVNPDNSFAPLGFGGSSTSSMLASAWSTDVFYSLPENESLYIDSYELKAGHWPQNNNELVLVLFSDGSITDFMLYTLGFRDSKELDQMIEQFMNEEDVDTSISSRHYAYEDFLGIKFKLVNSAGYYRYDAEYDIWVDKSDDEDYMMDLIQRGEDLEIVGVVKRKEDTDISMLSSGIYYPYDMTSHVTKVSYSSMITQEQLDDKNWNVFTGRDFNDTESPDIDFNSMFAINTDLLGNAFQFDTSKLSFDASMFSDLSELDFSSSMGDSSSFSMDMSSLPDMDLESILKDINVEIDYEEAGTLIEDVFTSYTEYAKKDPATDFTQFPDALRSFLSESSTQTFLQNQIQQMIEQGGYVTTDTIVQLITEKYLERIAQPAPEDESDPTEEVIPEPETGDEGEAEPPVEGEEEVITEPTLIDMLNALTPEDLQDIISQLVSQQAEAEITREDMETLAVSLLGAYTAYAQERGDIPDPTKLSSSFEQFMTNGGGETLITKGITKVINVDDLQKQLSGAFNDIGGAFGEAITSMITEMMGGMVDQITTGITSSMEKAMTQLAEQLPEAIHFDTGVFARAFSMTIDPDDMQDLIMSMMSSAQYTYDGNLRKLGYIDMNKPSSISIYPRDFEGKAEVIRILDEYNERMKVEDEDKVITYTDLVGTLMSSVTDIVDTVSYVLIAFVAISLVVSSIMIGVITYISVLERRKEIGILRAIGASKRNISEVFNAETFIIGLLAGLFGIGITELLLIPGNYLIHTIADNSNVNAYLPIESGLILIVLSVILTLIGGIIPSRKAAKSDPVTALRTE